MHHTHTYTHTHLSTQFTCRPIDLVLFCLIWFLLIQSLDQFPIFTDFALFEGNKNYLTHFWIESEGRKYDLLNWFFASNRTPPKSPNRCETLDKKTIHGTKLPLLSNLINNLQSNKRTKKDFNFCISRKKMLSTVLKTEKNFEMWFHQMFKVRFGRKRFLLDHCTANLSSLYSPKFRLFLWSSSCVNLTIQTGNDLGK